MVRISIAFALWLVIASVCCEPFQTIAVADDTEKNAKPKKNNKKESPAEVKKAEEYLEKWRQREVKLTEDALADLDETTKTGKREGTALRKKLASLEKNKNPKLGPLQLTVGHVGYMRGALVVQEVVDEKELIVSHQLKASPFEYFILRGEFGVRNALETVPINGVMCVTKKDTFYSTDRSERISTVVVEQFDDEKLQRALKDLEPV